jgi:DNA-binding NtrC family response regulator
MAIFVGSEAATAVRRSGSCYHLPDVSTGSPDGPVTAAVVATGAVTETHRERLRLFVPYGADKGTSLEVDGRARTIGADEGCDLRLGDRSVSRRHAEVWCQEGRLAVRDLGSTNGTTFQDARIREAEVPMGATLRFGAVEVRVVPAERSRPARHDAPDRIGGMVGRDPRLREVFTLVQDLADRDTTVVVHGETGSGKELVARALHSEGRRRHGPFVVVDCAGQPRDLIESQLFGHVQGAFTGATQGREGAFVQAHGGTLFLDEVGELPLELQPRFLRALEQREIQPVGSDHRRSVDVRVVAASHRDLRAGVKDGTFREDLYYRLSVVTVRLPALRDRLDDLPLLVREFADRHGLQLELDPDDERRLRAHAWPGNVRELRNLVERACLVGGARPLSDHLDADGIPLSGLPVDADFKESKAEVVAAFERRYLQELMTRHRGNLSRAAREAKLDRKHLRELLRRHGVTGARDDA